MKAIFYSWWLLCALTVPAVRARADSTIKEADYPNQYEVVDTSKADKLVVEKICTMTLRDRAKTGVNLNVAKTGYGSCHVLDSGMVYRGRLNEKKNAIELVIPVGDTKAKVETWQIVGTVSSPGSTATAASTAP